jgi:hypothetical protein
LARGIGAFSAPAESDADGIALVGGNPGRKIPQQKAACLPCADNPFFT